MTTDHLPTERESERSTPPEQRAAVTWPVYLLAFLSPPLAMWVVTRSVKRAAICVIVSAFTLGIGGVIMAVLAIRRRSSRWNWTRAPLSERLVLVGGITIGILFVATLATMDEAEVVGEDAVMGGTAATATAAVTGNQSAASPPVTATAGSVRNATTTTTPTNRAAVGELIRVGDLDLTILQTGAFNATQYNQFNDENFVVRFKATNARGRENAEYTVSPSAFKVVDASGVVYDGGFCAGCPNALQYGSSGLTRGGGFERSVYFAVPAGVALTSIIYQPTFSSNRVMISLP